jgi:hypothetical protein
VLAGWNGYLGPTVRPLEVHVEWVLIVVQRPSEASQGTEYSQWMTLNVRSTSLPASPPRMINCTSISMNARVVPVLSLPHQLSFRVIGEFITSRDFLIRLICNFSSISPLICVTLSSLISYSLVALPSPTKSLISPSPARPRESRLVAIFQFIDFVTWLLRLRFHSRASNFAAFSFCFRL